VTAEDEQRDTPELLDNQAEETHPPNEMGPP
jgi:hypothetical protein